MGRIYPGVQRRLHPPRIVSLALYRWETQRDFDEHEVERVLVDAKRRGLVREYDTGRGRIVWFEGAPGKQLRRLRRKIEQMIAPYGARRLAERDP